MTKTLGDRLAQDFGTKVRTMIQHAERAGETKTVSAGVVVCKHYWRAPRDGEPKEVSAICDWCGAYGEDIA